MRNTQLLLIAMALLFTTSLAWALLEHNSMLALQRGLSQRDQVIVDRDTLITQLDTAIHLAESVLKLKPPSDSQYLTMYQSQRNEGQTTKIFLNDTGASYFYQPAYPFATPWTNGSGPFSSRREFELTNSRSIALSFWGWQFSAGGMYGGVTGGEKPSLSIGVTVRNDYTQRI